MTKKAPHVVFDSSHRFVHASLIFLKLIQECETLGTGGLFGLTLVPYLFDSCNGHLGVGNAPVDEVGLPCPPKGQSLLSVYFGVVPNVGCAPRIAGNGSLRAWNILSVPKITRIEQSFDACRPDFKAPTWLNVMMYKRAILGEVSPVILRSAGGGRWLTSWIFELVIKHMCKRMICYGHSDVMRYNMVATKIPSYIFRGIHVNMCPYELPPFGMVGLWTGHLEVIYVDG